MYGTSKLATLYNKLSQFITIFSNETIQTEKDFNVELYQLRITALQTRQALDFVLASSGGVCALIKTECCSFVPDTSIVANRHIQVAEDALSKWKEEEKKISTDSISNFFNGLWSWVPGIQTWAKGLMTILASGLVFVGMTILIWKLLCACTQLAMRRINQRPCHATAQPPGNPLERVYIEMDRPAGQ